MTRTRHTGRIFLYIFIFFIACFILVTIKHRTYNWDDDVQKHIDSFNCKLLYIDSFKDDSNNLVVYRYQTMDDLKISFEVQCFWANISLPFGFDIPIKKPVITDNFAEQICVHISENKGEYHIENKSIEEISTYVLDTIECCDNLFEKYGIKNMTPVIHFQFVTPEQTYSFKYGNTNKTILYDKLLNLLYS